MDNNKINTNTMDNTLKFWRDEIKGKQRGIYNCKDRINLAINKIKERIYKKILRCDNWLKKECYYTDVGKYKFLDKEWMPIRVGDLWGGKNVSCFFKQTVKIPDYLKGEKVKFLLYLGGDSLVKINGKPYQGLDPFRNEILLTENAKGGEIFNIEVESYHVWRLGEPLIKKIECSDLAAIDTEIEEIYWDFKAVYNGLFIQDINIELESFIKNTLNEAVRYIKPGISGREEFLTELKKGKKILHERIFESDNFKINGTLKLVGHSHLDVVFLWQYKEFVRKVGRTHSTMLRLLEQYPDFIFSQNQVIIYRVLKENYPTLFKQIKQRVKEKRWEILGPLWVESDLNLISGESIVRQIMHGANFLQKEFGFIPKIIWHPDMFGACYTLPQILKKSGMEYFVTNKLGVWNDTNPWKLNSFLWEGPDGSRVFAVTPPIHFIGTAEADHISKCVKALKNNTGEDETIYCYGWGDGGGGVDTEMLEYARRYKRFPGLPGTKSSRAIDALRQIKGKNKNPVVYKDELYLEAHRGAYTTKSRLKKINRKLENQLREAEIFLVICTLLDKFNYPEEELSKAWETLLTNQFHDSITGTHIGPVYADIINDYKDLTENVRALRNNALGFISTKVKKIYDKKAVIVFNSTQRKRSSIAYFDFLLDKNTTIVDEDNVEVAYQYIKNIQGSHKTVLYAEHIPACGYRVFYLDKKIKKEKVAIKNPHKISISREYFENKFFKVKFNKSGEITSIFDKNNGFEIIKENGLGNKFSIYEDVPSEYEAWDITKKYKDKELDLSPGKITVIEKGPVCWALLLKKKILNSYLKQRIIFYNDIPRIDFETEIDWKERRKLLRVGFDINVMARDYTCDIAFGNIKRPAYRNNTFEQAKFEVSAHNWIDLSEDSYGVAIFTDCKYGFDVEKSKMSITLLKGPVYPDPDSDIEKSSFTYSLFPHKGYWKDAEVNQRALEFNNPLICMRNEEIAKERSLPGEFSFLKINKINITLEAVKKSDNDEGIVVRLVERYGRNSNACLTVFKNIKNVFECDLLENNLEKLKPDANNLKFNIAPYEIKTFKIYF